jgi:hypothetical protein
MADNYDQLKNVLNGYVGQITDAVTLAQAQITLDDYIEASRAFSNITRSAAASYSDARGSVTKRAIDDARENRDGLWDDLIGLIELGGITPPTSRGSMDYWDLSGNLNA